MENPPYPYLPNNREPGILYKFSEVNKFGRTTNADTSVITDIWDRANVTEDQDLWRAPTDARIHAIVSASANDAAAGTGARTLSVEGIDSDWLERQEIVTLAGATPVNTVHSYHRVFRMECKTFGSGGTNAGLITATSASDDTVTAQINANEGQTFMAIYTIPIDALGYITQYYGSVNLVPSSGSVRLRLVTREHPDVEAGFVGKHTQTLSTTGSSYLPHPFRPYMTIAPKTDIKLQAISDTNNFDVSGGFDLILARKVG